MQARIARARHRSPSTAAPVDEDHVVELVDRLEAQDERRIAVLFEHDGREQRGLEAVRAAMADDAAKASQRGAAGRRLRVVGQAVEEPLDRRAASAAERSAAARASVNAAAMASVVRVPDRSGPAVYFAPATA